MMATFSVSRTLLSELLLFLRVPQALSIKLLVVAIKRFRVSLEMMKFLKLKLNTREFFHVIIVVEKDLDDLILQLSSVFR